MELLLIRHAEPVRIVEAGQAADPPLTPRGLEQADRLAAYLADERIDSVWSSPLRRARETAAPLGDRLDLEVLVDLELAEYDREATSYIPVEELRATRDERWLAMVEGDLEGQGVDPEAFRDGVVRAIERVVAAHPGGTVAVVAHGGVINAYVGHVLGIERLLWFEPRYTSIQRVFASRDGVRSVAALNEVAHLRGTELLP